VTTTGLAGRRALITGSTGGLGFAMAEALAAAGCHVVLAGVEPAAAVEAHVRSLRDAHAVNVEYVRGDLSIPKEVEALVSCANACLNGIDVLINNAVVRHFAPIEAFPLAEWDRALAVNLTAAFQLVRLVLGGMRERGFGRIINMSSVYGSRGTAGRVDYVTTKHALIGLTRAVAMETLGHGITCNAVCPGSVRTPAIEARIAALTETGLSLEAAEAAFLAGKQPTGCFVEARHVAELVVFLCGEAARDITGAVLPVDGGWTAS
jgi:3-hydroxybutyrate dehydrogenase